MAIRFFNNQDVFGDATIEGILQVGPVGSGLKVDNSSNDYNVGIGTASPASPLHIKVSGTGGSNIFSLENDSNKYDFRLNGSTLLLRDGSNDRVSVTSAGNVGIGTTSPLDKLHVEGGIVIQNGNNLQWGGLYSASAPTIYAATNYLSFVPTGITGAATRGMRLTATGLGIGTTSPSYKLDVAGTTRSTTFLSANATNSTGLQITSATTSGQGAVIRLTKDAADRQVYQSFEGDQLYLGLPASNTTLAEVGTKGSVDLRFATAYTERMRITSAGNVGIGTTSPDAKLEVVGSNALRIHDGTDQGSIFFRGDRDDVYIKESNYQLLFGAPSGMVFELDTNSNDGDLFNVTHRNNSRLYINGASGKVGIGTTAPSTNLEVASIDTTGTPAIIRLTSRDISVIDEQELSEIQFYNSDADGAHVSAYIKNIAAETYGRKGQLAFGVSTTNSTNAVEALRINENGNVGIGTDAPSSKLHIVDTTAMISTQASVEVLKLQRKHAAGDIKASTEGHVSMWATDSNSNYEWARMSWLNDNTSDSGPENEGSLHFWTNNAGTVTRAMSIDHDQNVGIGTTSPNQKLQVSGPSGTAISISTPWAGGAYGQLRFDTGTGNSSIRSSVPGNSTNGLDFYTYSSATSETVKMSITGTGNVGIGTTNPAQKLSIDNGYILIKDNAYDTYFLSKTRSDGSQLVGFQSHSVGALSIHSNSVERMRIDSTGNVGIGTTSPAYKLDVSGTARISNDIALGAFNEITGVANDNLVISVDKDNLSGSSSIDFQLDGATSALFINNSRYVGIGTTSPGAKLHVIGSGENGGILFNNSGAQEHRFYTSANSQFNTIGSSTPIWQWAQFTGVGVSPNYKMTLNNTGLGIGTTNPVDLLHINSNTHDARMILDSAAGFDGELKFFENGSAKYTIGYDAGTSNFVIGTINVDTGQRLAITSAGNVGIGTTSPVGKLSVREAGTGVYFTRFAGDDGTTGPVIAFANDSTKSIIAATGDGIIFRTRTVGGAAFSGSEKMRITSGGNVGIGTTSPDDRLDVIDGNAQMVFGTASSDRSYIQFKHNAVPVDGEELVLMDFSGYNDASQSTRYVILTSKAEDVTDGSEDGSLTFQTMAGGTATQSLTMRSGQVGIGTASPLRKLHVVGNFAVNAAAGEYYGVNITGGEGANPNILIGDWHNSSATLTWDSVNNFLRIDSQHSTSGAPIVFSGNDAATEYARFTATGNLGIGTTAPYSKFTTYGALSTSTSQISIVNSEGGHTILRTGISGVTNAGFSLISANADGSNQTTRVVVSSAGNVGIGTTSPANKLVVASDASPTSENTYAIAAASASDKAYKTIIGYDYANDVGLIAAVRTGIGWRNISIPQGNVGIGTTSPTQKLDVNGYTRATSGFVGSSGLKLFGDNSSTNFVFVATNGNVGIGTTSPAKKLHVVDSANEVAYFQGTGNSAWIDIKGAASELWSVGATSVGYGIFNRTDGSYRFNIDNGGNVGIGTTSPTSYGSTSRTLEVRGASGTGTGLVRVSAADNSVAGALYANSGEVVLNTQTNNSLSFATNNNVKMRITSAGNVGIGTTSPAAKLDVIGGVGAWAANNTSTLQLFNGRLVGAGRQIANLVSYNGNGALDLYDGANTLKIHIQGSGSSYFNAGNVGIGTTSPSSKLEVSGSSLTELKVTESGSSVTTMVQSSTSYGWVGTKTNHTMYIGANDGAKITVLGTGNVGIGTTNPGYTLDVSGDIKASSSYRYGSRLFKNNNFIELAGNNSNILFLGRTFFVNNATDQAVNIELPNEAIQGYLKITLSDSYSNKDITGSLTKLIPFGYNQNNGIWNNGSNYQITEAVGGVATEFTIGDLAWDATNSIYYIPIYKLSGAGNALKIRVEYFGESASRIADGVSLSSVYTQAAPAPYNVRHYQNINDRLGIGTTSPSEKLEVNGNIRLGNSSSLLWGSNNLTLKTASSSTIGIFSLAPNSDGTVYAPRFQMLNASSVVGVSIRTDANSYFNGGNVGIGTTNPGAKLHIKGTTAASSETVLILEGKANGVGEYTELLFKNSWTTDENSYIRQVVGANTTTQDITIGSFDGTTTNEIIRFEGISSNVGIGTTSPEAKLHVVADNSTMATFESIGPNANSKTFIVQSGGDRVIFDIKEAAGGAAADLAFQLGDSEVMRLVDTGNVGIGTTSPGARLQVSSSGLGQNINDTTTQAIFNSSNVNNSKLYIQDYRTSAGNDWTFSGKRIQEKIDSTWMGYMQFNGTGNNGGISFGTGTSTTQSAISEKMRITASGNVGIGTNNPSQKLEVRGGIINVGETDTQQAFIGADGSGVGYAGTFTNHDFQLRVNNSARVVIDTSGNVGIGTTSPSVKLQVGGVIRSKGTSANIDVDSLYGAFRFNNGTTFTGGFYNDAVLSSGNAVDLVTYIASGDYYISTTSTSKAVTVKQGGNVGINNTNPSAKLDVVGTMSVDGDSTFQQFIKSPNMQNYANNNDAILGGLTPGTLYHTNGIVKIVI